LETLAAKPRRARKKLQAKALAALSNRYRPGIDRTEELDTTAASY